MGKRQILWSCLETLPGFPVCPPEPAGTKPTYHKLLTPLSGSNEHRMSSGPAWPEVCSRGLSRGSLAVEWPEVCSAQKGSFLLRDKDGYFVLAYCWERAPSTRLCR